MKTVKNGTRMLIVIAAMLLLSAYLTVGSLRPNGRTTDVGRLGVAARAAQDGPDGSVRSPATPALASKLSPTVASPQAAVPVAPITPPAAPNLNSTGPLSGALTVEYVPRGVPLFGGVVQPTTAAGAQSVKVGAAGDVRATVAGTVAVRSGGDMGNLVYVYGYVDPVNRVSYNTVTAGLAAVSVQPDQTVARNSRIGQASGPVVYQVWTCVLPATADPILSNIINKTEGCYPVDPQNFLAE